MPSASFTRRVAHNPDELLDMVADVEKYPEFISLVAALRVTNRKSEAEYEAEAVIAYKMLRESFRSDIKVDRAARTIHVTKAQKGGAVKALENRWVFHPLPDGTTLIEFFVDVSLALAPLNFLVREKMSKASDVIMGAFEARAAQVCDAVQSKGLDLAAEHKRLGLKG